MKHTRTWVLLGLLVAGGGLVVLSEVSAQRPNRPLFLPPSMVGRYHVVKVDGDQVYLLDTTTGDLYSASLGRDSKPYGERPHAGEAAPKEQRKNLDKDKVPDKDVSKDKDASSKRDFDKDKAPDK
jgi:hypothetical protein